MILLMFLLLATPIVMTIHIARMRRKNRVRIVDLGVAFTWIIFLYAFLPMLGIWLASMGIGALEDDRLGHKVPDPSLVLAVGSSYAAFMVGFALVYSRRRIPHSHRSVMWQLPTSADFISIVALVVIIKLGLLLLRFFFGADIPDDYTSSYTVYRGQPILIQQLAGALTAVDLAATMLLIVVAVAYTRRFYWLIAAVLVLQIVIAVAGGGSRTSAFLCAFAFVVALTVYSRRLRPWLLAALATGGVVAFLIAGEIRGGINAGEGPTSLQLLQGGEFLAVFDNSLDLLSRRGHNDFLPLRVQMYLVDVLRLIPQQVLGDLKVNPAAFYVSNYYPDYSDAGGAWAFGAIAESTVGFGWPEALVRGALLGWLYAAVANHCLRRQLTVVRVFVYVWFVVVCYQAIRDTTFTTFALFVLRVLPLLIVLRLTGTLRNVKRVRGIVRPTTGPQRL
jgi:oligosaccharide repeat unit polymerase